MYATTNLCAYCLIPGSGRVSTLDVLCVIEAAHNLCFDFTFFDLWDMILLDFIVDTLASPGYFADFVPCACLDFEPCSCIDLDP